MSNEKISVKSAIKKAFEYAKDFYPDSELKNLALEEVRFNDEDMVWEVTLGFDGKRKMEEFIPPTSSVSYLLGGREKKAFQERIYKTFRLSAFDGNFVEMAIRQVE